MLSGSYGLVLHELDIDLFLHRAQTMTGADGVSLVRWLENHPVVELSDSVGGAATTLPVEIKEALDEFLEQQPDLPVALDRFVDESTSANSKLRDFFCDPSLMAVLLDTQPSRILILFSRSHDNKSWSEEERYSYLEVARVMRQSVRLHKLVDSMKSMIETARGLINTSPSGMIILSPNGEIHLANRVATSILNRGDGICIRNKQLHIKDRQLDEEFRKLLTAALDMPPETTWQFQWHRAIPRQENKTPYQLSLQILSLREWHIESRKFDRVLVAFLVDPTGLAAPTIDQLTNYYGFTDAQAKVALALWGGTGIREAAEKLSITVNTARTHLRAIYDKVGVASHAELMAVLTASVNRASNRVSEGEFYQELGQPDPNNF